jgi:hypothetical protein
MKNTITFQIKGFPGDLNKALKLKSVKSGATLRQYVIDALRKAAA